MSQPDIEKKKRKRSARVYINANRPLAVPLDEIAEHFPSDDDDDAPTPAHSRARAEIGKRDVGTAERRELASEGRALPNLSYPVKTHQDAENALAHIGLGHGNVKDAKRMLRRVARKEGWSDIVDALDGKEPAQKAVGNPVDMPGGRNLTDRLSPSRATGQGAPSPGDHNAAVWQDPMNVPGPRELAFRHPDLRQSSTSPFPLSVMQSFNGDNQFGDRDITLGAGRVNLQRLDAAAASGLCGPAANPAARPMPHSAPINTGGPNGGHSLANPTSTPPSSALKNSERLEIMKRHMFPGSGGAR